MQEALNIHDVFNTIYSAEPASQMQVPEEYKQQQSLPVLALPSFLLAMMMACFDRSATWFMSLDHTTYLMKGVLSSPKVVRC